MATSCEHDIKAALAAMNSELSSIRQQMLDAQTAHGTCQTARVEGYKRAVPLVDKHRAALVDESTGNLRNGVWEAIRKACPQLNRTAFSSAWQAFKRNPVAFVACAAVRDFRRITRADEPPDLAKLFARYSAAVKAAPEGGIDKNRLLRILNQRTDLSWTPWCCSRKGVLWMA